MVAVVRAQLREHLLAMLAIVTSGVVVKLHDIADDWLESRNKNNNAN